MTTTFKNAPLLEIIAELRWNDDVSEALRLPTDGSAIAAFQPIDSSRVEELFMRFGGECYANGFQRSERLSPQGLPLLLGHPVYRYKRGSLPDSELFQIGAGIFSANALPPYSSWASFRPTVFHGIKSLIAARLDGTKEKPFSALSLRYINSFGHEFTNGMNSWEFVNEILGFKVQLPAAMSETIPLHAAPRPLIQLSYPTSNEMTMSLSVGEGLVSNQQVVLLDISLSASRNISANPDEIIERFDLARSVLHEFFIKATSSIHEKMKPEA